ncbi:hypothetical protein CkaCkLH20_01378 [Colletotrichum karsti]|uniref:Uncharacterized protein n=1 Tax=Colletotrichum karsti TaxID=1095194 RepID=A0A9P6ICU0_9PEZI|nr:uncharacterized protein CkaCkLH20_01378 [Colletotrichum karsti]KAF9881228.1 hypothetical protein CkaCkLH20_01378 [Colletotrichum karsti]
MRNFFIQARAFEVCRSIIFNEASFLAAPEWMRLTDALADTGDGAPGSALNEMLKLIVLCSSLRVRTSQFIQSLTATSSSSSGNTHLDALEIATEGFELCEAMEEWKSKASFQQQNQQEALLSTTFYSATRIYLSGNYDYDLQHWRAMAVAVPVLHEDQVNEHFETIIHTTRSALKSSRLSPLLFLFPLRVAGARARRREQRDAVSDLLREVRKQFVVADAMLDELKKLWSRSPIAP